MTTHMTRLLMLSGILVGLSSMAFAAGMEAEVSVSPYYTSNAFGLKDEWIDNFAQKQGPGERFEGLSSPWDFVTPLRAEAARRWKSGDGLRFTAGGSIEYERDA